MNEYTVVEINTQPVELCKLLKIANLVGGGGEAKIVISEGYVFLNGEVEFQKRKKVHEHDIIEFNGEIIQVALNQNYVPAPAVGESKNNKSKKPDLGKNATKSSAKHSAKKPKNNQSITAEQVPQISTDQKSKRRPISF